MVVVLESDFGRGLKSSTPGDSTFDSVSRSEVKGDRLAGLYSAGDAKAHSAVAFIDGVCSVLVAPEALAAKAADFSGEEIS